MYLSSADVQGIALDIVYYQAYHSAKIYFEAQTKERQLEPVTNFNIMHLFNTHPTFIFHAKYLYANIPDPFLGNIPYVIQLKEVICVRFISFSYRNQPRNLHIYATKWLHSFTYYFDYDYYEYILKISEINHRVRAEKWILYFY